MLVKEREQGEGNADCCWATDQAALSKLEGPISNWPKEEDEPACFWVKFLGLQALDYCYDLFELFSSIPELNAYFFHLKIT